MTNLTVALCDLKDAQKETKFENCLADVNIPVGEVFTSPKLKGTNGLLHVTEVYLNGLCYKDLKITFKDGMVDDYECANFPDKEDGRKFIKENLLYNRETLPMGEWAIGTNTTAYVMAASMASWRNFQFLSQRKWDRISLLAIHAILTARMSVCITRMAKKSWQKKTNVPPFEKKIRRRRILIVIRILRFLMRNFQELQQLLLRPLKFQL